MGSVRHISVTTVRPANPNESTQQRIELSPLDLRNLAIGFIQKGILFHKPTLHQQNELGTTVTDHLKSSLSRVLDFFFPLSGRLGSVKNEDDGTTSFFIDCKAAGALFVHAAADGVSLADILEPVYIPRIVHSFFPLNGVVNYESVSEPLLAVQVTELTDGIFIGCTINHAVVDGTSFWHFFNSWSQLSRSDCISRPPHLKRWFLDDNDCPVRVLFTYEANPCCSSALHLLQERMFHFTNEKIALLKAKANSEMSTSRISSLQALLAHVWRSINKSRKLEPDQHSNYILAIGVRSRMQPPLPEQYFGNAILGGIVTMKAGDLLMHGLGHVAMELNKAISLQTNEKIRNSLESWMKDPKPLGTLPGNLLLTGSSPRFNVYGNDFGWGKPVAVRSGSANKFDGKITVFPGREEGSMDIEACLLPETLEAMGDDAEFMEAVTV